MVSQHTRGWRRSRPLLCHQRSAKLSSFSATYRESAPANVSRSRST